MQLFGLVLTLEHAEFSLFGGLCNAAYRFTYPRHTCHLLPRPARDLLCKAGRNLGNLGEFLEALSGHRSHPVAFFHLAGSVLYARDHLAHLVLHGFNQSGNASGGLARAFGQLANLVCHDGKSAACAACTRRLNRGVQGNQVGLGRDARNGVHNFRNLEAAVSQRLDALGDALHLAADGLHSTQRRVHRLLTLLSGLERFLSGLACFIGIRGHSGDALTYFLHLERHLCGCNCGVFGARGDVLGAEQHTARAVAHVVGYVSHVFEGVT